jgi:putative cardiolipin synthase
VTRFSILSMTAIVLSLVACSSPAPRQPSGLFDFLQGSNESARSLTDEEIIAASSSGPLKAKRLRVLVDNDSSFQTKIEALRSAKSGDVVRLSYYIYTDDHSSAVFWQEMLAAAKRGAEIKLFADLITNYLYVDLFSYLEKESRGRIQTRFFMSLSDSLKRDLSFLTRPCPPHQGAVTPSTCSAAKWAEIERSPAIDPYAKLLLSGLLKRSATAAKTALVEGQQLDLAKMRSGAGSKEDTAQLVEFLKLLVKAKFQKDAVASVKVALAYSLYGDKLNPVMNQINGIVPLEQTGESSVQDWEHITDFTHHKFLMIGHRFLQIGGRNIENSYHTKPSELTKKYIFKDVDAAIEIEKGGEAVARSFDQYWSFPALTLSLADVLKIAPPDFVMNIEAAEKSLQACSKGAFGATRRAAVADCLAKNIPKHPSFKNLDQRLMQVESTMEKNAKIYRETYRPVVNETWSTADNMTGDISKRDLASSLITYVENIHFDKHKNANARTRIYGSKPGKELESGKYLHYLWLRGMENVCATTAAAYKQNPSLPRQRVILHSAYFLPPAIMMKTLAKMIDGTWDCRGVRVTILTNSMETTDLNVINLIGRYQMTAFYNVYSQRDDYFGDALYQDDRSQDPRFNRSSRSTGRAAIVDYFELKNMDAQARVSLHAKVAILGKDALIGSANGDVRSYYMDTNNGLYLKNVPEFVKSYTAWLDKQIADRGRTRSLVAAFTGGGIPVDVTRERLHAEDRQLLKIFLDKRAFGKKVSPQHRTEINQLVEKVTNMVYDSTLKIMAPSKNEGEDKFQREQEQLQTMEQFDRWLQLL